VFTPAYAIAYRDAAFACRRTSARCWLAFFPHRRVSTTLAISAAVHLAVLLAIGSALYQDGQDDQNIPELSVQLESRDGPMSEEFTEAALPTPMPDPVEEVIDDPGTSAQTLDAEALADATPLSELVPDASPAEQSLAEATKVAEAGTVLTTTSDSENTVALVEEPTPVATLADIPKPEQVMLSRSVQKLAQQLLDTNKTDAELTWQQDGKQYSARVLRQPAADSTGIEQVIAEIMTDKNGKRMKTRLSLKRLAFSHFTQLVNHWDPNIQLHDDIIDGRFHSNTEISLTARFGVEPRFFGKVTTAAATMTFDSFSRRRNKDVFQAGYETRTERVMLPREMPDVVNGGEEGDRRLFTEDTRIIFNPDGSYVWRPANGAGALNREGPSDRPRYLIGDKGAKLYVRGTVAGIFTVYSPNDIEVEDDLVYSKDPRQTLLSRDFLALIAGRDIAIAGPEVTGAGDLTVHGAIFARRRFYIESTDRGGEATLFIYGSLTTGTISQTEPRYATKLDFDKRFEYLRPASFPMTRRYEVEDWDPDWQEVEKPSETTTGSLAQSQ
jgi:hypothetical protein